MVKIIISDYKYNFDYWLFDILIIWDDFVFFCLVKIFFNYCKV